MIGISTLRGNLIEPIKRCHNRCHTDAHTSTCANGIIIIKTSNQSTSATGDESILPDDSGCSHHRLFDTGLMKTAKHLSVFCKHRGSC